MWKKLLIKLKIVDVISNQERRRKGLRMLGKGYTKSYRLNPFNPISYIAFILFLIIGILSFGAIGITKEMNVENPFKWN